MLIHLLNFIRDANSLLVAALAFVWIFGAAILGFVVQRFIPGTHFSADSRDAAKLGAGLVATLAALILSLLISSTKGTFDRVNDQLNEVGANYIHLDRLLANYGPDTAPIRAALRAALETKLQAIWPEESANSTVIPFTAPSHFERMAAEITSLKPANAYQAQLKTGSLQLNDNLIQERFLIEVIGEGSVPPLLMVIPVIWVSFLTFLYALFSPRNSTVVAVLLVCSLSIAAAIFLIDEMAGPLDGYIKVPSAPLRFALDQLGQ
jgi:hypothetical protein